MGQIFKFKTYSLPSSIIKQFNKNSSAQNIILNFIFLLFVSINFFSCKGDETVTPIYNSSEAYDWSVKTLEGDPYNISALNRNTYFAGSLGQFYKVTNGTAELFTVNASVFRAVEAFVYDESYIVFMGYRLSDSHVQYMVYDNGTYTIYNIPETSIADLDPVYIAERGTFYFGRHNTTTYYKFKNGVFTLHAIPSSDAGVYFGKANGKDYVYKRTDVTTYNFYQLTDSGYTGTFTSSALFSLFRLNSGIISYDNITNTVSSFTGAGFTFKFNFSDSQKYALYAKGSNENSFAALFIDTTNHFQMSHWDGSNFTKQINVPAEVNTTGLMNYTVTNYIDNTFYIHLIAGGAPSKLVKVTLK